MELNADILESMFEYLPTEKLLDFRETSQEMKHMIDNSPFWCLRLKKDFNIVNKDRKHCFKIYKDLYSQVKSFYDTFLLVTPFIKRLLNLEEDPVESFAEAMYQAQSNPSEGYVEKLFQFYNNKQMRDFYHKFVMYNDEGVDFMRVMQFERDNKHVGEDLLYFEKEFYAVSDLLYGLFHTESHAYKNHPIRNKYLDIFTLAWGGDIDKSREEKMKFIIDQQNKLFKQFAEKYEIEEGYQRYYRQ